MMISNSFPRLKTMAGTLVALILLSLWRFDLQMPELRHVDTLDNLQTFLVAGNIFSQ